MPSSALREICLLKELKHKNIVRQGAGGVGCEAGGWQGAAAPLLGRPRGRGEPHPPLRGWSRSVGSAGPGRAGASGSPPFPSQAPRRPAQRQEADPGLRVLRPGECWDWCQGSAGAGVTAPQPLHLTRPPLASSQDLKKYFDSCNGDLDPEIVKVRLGGLWKPSGTWRSSCPVCGIASRHKKRTAASRG